MRALAPLVLLAACAGPAAPASGDLLPPAEARARLIFDATPITLAGTVTDAHGAPLAGVTVQVGDATAVSDAAGAWSIAGLPRRNALVQMEADGFRPDLRAAWLYREVAVGEVVLDPVALHAADPGTVRFLFGGDVSFGRRFLDPTGQVPPDEVPPWDPAAQIKSTDPLPGTQRVLAGLAPLFATADVGVVDLESVVTADPRTPHPTKTSVYFSLPASLPALVGLGVQYVSLGNDHTYDYLEQGVVDTMAAVTGAGLGWSGLGRTPDEAWAPYRQTWGGTPYSLVSATSVSGSQDTPPYVASDTQGGAADLHDSTRLRAAFAGERTAGRVPIALLHTGTEYSATPSAYAQSRAHDVIDAGAALVVSNHAHFAQGFSAYAGVPIAWCLGDLAYDDVRLETHAALVLQVELAGDQVRSLQAIPIELDEYRPRMVTGELADTTLRRAAELSDVPVFPWGGRDLVGAASQAVDRTVDVDVEVPDAGWTIVDLRSLERPGESLARVQGPGTVRPGRDILRYGDMENEEVGQGSMLEPYWDVSASSRFPCLIGAHRGALGLCQVRSWRNLSGSVIAFRDRARVWGDAVNQPEKELSLYGWVRGDNAGPLAVIVRYEASSGTAQLGAETPFFLTGGTFAWQPFQADLAMPPDQAGGTSTTNARAVQLLLRSSPPREGESLVAWDDLAVIGWEETLDATAGATLSTPHARDFLRFEAPPGSYSLELTFRRDKPSPPAP